MEKIKQHSMIILPRGYVHPVFSGAFFPENLASLVETIFFIFLWLNILFISANLVFIIDPILLPDNAVASIFQTSSDYFLAQLVLKMM